MGSLPTFSATPAAAQGALPGPEGIARQPKTTGGPDGQPQTHKKGGSEIPGVGDNRHQSDLN